MTDVINEGESVQREIDRASAAVGGVVTVPPGVYVLRDSLHLRSGVVLRGATGAVLTRGMSVSSPIADFLGYGHCEFTVRDPDLFSPGMGVHLTDERAGGFYDTVATVIGQSGRLFFIDRMLNHDYLPENGGRATSLFPLISGIGVESAGVENLVLDGNPHETAELNGCRGGAVFLLGCHRVQLKELEVRHYFGDGISFQQCTDVYVAGCAVHDNSGNGLHPGSGSVRYVMERNRIYKNGRCGIYYCLRTTHSRCAENVISDNGGDGVSIGERDTDHAVERNTIRWNGGYGIEFRRPISRGGDRVSIDCNQIGPNARGEIFIPAGVDQIAITGNSFQSHQRPAVVLEGADRAIGCDIPVGVENEQILSEEAVWAYKSVAQPLLGPAAASTDAALHLRPSSLEPWREPPWEYPSESGDKAPSSP